MLTALCLLAFVCIAAAVVSIYLAHLDHRLLRSIAEFTPTEGELRDELERLP